MEYEARTLDFDWSCVCEHAMSEHRVYSGVCLVVERGLSSCSCTEFRVSDQVAPLERVKIISAQVWALHVILREAQERGLAPDEERAIAELAQAVAELTDAARALLGNRG